MFLILYLIFCEIKDVALKEEANKKAFEKFAKESSSNHSVEDVQVSERYESQFPTTLFFINSSCNCNLTFVT